MIKQITLTGREQEVLEFIQKQEGQPKLTDVIHSCIANYYRIQYFNKQYMVRGKKPLTVEPDMTQEQICEALGGKVSKNESGPVCLIPRGRNHSSVPMSLMGQKGELGDYRLKR